MSALGNVTDSGEVWYSVGIQKETLGNLEVSPDFLNEETHKYKSWVLSTPNFFWGVKVEVKSGGEF